MERSEDESDRSELLDGARLAFRGRRWTEVLAGFRAAEDAYLEDGRPVPSTLGIAYTLLPGGDIAMPSSGWVTWLLH